MKTSKVLIIDDSQDFRAAVRNYLNMHGGFEVYEASTGEMGVTKASCIRPDIVLMDLNLPHANGFETTRLIKSDHPHCEVITLTMFDVAACKDAARAAGASDFIGKSDVYDRLLPCIKKCLESRSRNGKVNKNERKGG